MADALDGHIISRRVTGGKCRDGASHGQEESKCTLKERHHDQCTGETSKQEGMDVDLCLLMKLILLVITSSLPVPRAFIGKIPHHPSANSPRVSLVRPVCPDKPMTCSLMD